MDALCDPSFETCEVIAPDFTDEETWASLREWHMQDHWDWIPDCITGDLWFILLSFGAAFTPIFWNFMFRNTYFATYNTVSVYYSIGW